MSAERWAVRETAWGDHEPEPVLLAMGPWRIEMRGDELADVAFDGSSVVRSVRAVVRDRDWNTVPAVVESIDVLADGCDVRLSMRGLGADIEATLEVRADATRLAVRLVATSHTRFASNRLGLVVLHPPAAAGADLVIGTASGGEQRTTFPVAVSPHQPAMEIRSLAWTLDGVTTTATFDGEVFEMEDQRNWTDASYKTYSTPLERPFPVVIPAGAVIEQSVAFVSTRVAPGTASDAGTDTGVVELVDTGRLVPGLVLGASTVPDTVFTAHELPAGAAGILVELDTRTPSWRAALDRAALECAGLPLDVRIVADHPDAVLDAVDAAAAAGPVARLAVFSGRDHMTEPELWAALTDAAARALPAADLLGGARSHFTELNRRHGDLPRDLPALAFSMTPQMHAIERAQLVESIAMQALVVRDAARIAAGRPLHVGPITLRPRFNAVATATATASSPADPTLTAGYGAELVAGANDVRQSSAALAAWTVASFAAISTADLGDGGLVADIAYFETIGPRGIRGDSGSFPVARAVELLASLAGGRLLAPREAAPDGIQVVGSTRADGSWRALVASLADRSVPLVLRHGGRTMERDVAPYEVVVIDSADR